MHNYVIDALNQDLNVDVKVFSSRLMFAAGREEHLPDVMAMVHVKKYTPSPAIILTV